MGRWIRCFSVYVTVVEGGRVVWLPYQLSCAVPPPVLRPRSSGVWRGAGLREAEEDEASSVGLVVGAGVRMLLAVSFILEKTLLGVGGGRAGEGRDGQLGMQRPGSQGCVWVCWDDSEWRERAKRMGRIEVYRQQRCADRMRHRVHAPCFKGTMHEAPVGSV